MCGFAGAVWGKNGTPLSLEVLQNMTAVLQHRGPDAVGFHHSDSGSVGRRESPGGVALGHRRLSVIDLDEGAQPMTNEDSSVWVVFNGEIYNYEELRRQLIARGHRFKSRSDTEVIVHLYEEQGIDCVRHLRGMFALALWDDNSHQLFLVRDRMGQKPLVYAEQSGRILFASEIKGLLQVPDIARELDAVSLDQYLLYQYVPHPRTIFRGISKIPPAHYGIYKDGKFQLQCYWKPSFEKQSLEPVEVHQERLRELITDAVRVRMRSDVPLGAFLSGGIDSTIIVGIMQQLSNRPIKTFSIGFPVAQFNETQYARDAANHLGTDHREYIVTPNVMEILPKLVWHYDEPFADSSAIPTYYLSQKTRQEVTVALTGDAGDELFAGYRRYRAVSWGQAFDQLPNGIKNVLTAKIWQQFPVSLKQKSLPRKAIKFLSAMRLDPVQRYLMWIGIFNDQLRNELYTDAFADLHRESTSGFFGQAYGRAESRDVVTRTSIADLLTYLPCDLLTKVDIASMAHGLECRSPLLDHHVVEAAISIPLRFKIKGWRAKKVFSDTFSDLIPSSIRRRSKMGFGVPLDHWFRNELRTLLQEVLLDPMSLNRGYFRKEKVQSMVREHLDRSWDHSARLWSLLIFELWHRLFLDNQPNIQNNMPPMFNMKV